jgi:hypothetical protein
LLFVASRQRIDAPDDYTAKFQVELQRHKEIDTCRRIRLELENVAPAEVNGVYNSPSDSIFCTVRTDIQEAAESNFDIPLDSNSGHLTMACTSFGLVIRILSLYLTILTLTSIYQAISPTSPHNKGKVIDHGAEFLQSTFHDLRVYYPRFDYLVQTANRVVLQVLLWVAMRYNVNTAVYTGIGIGVGLVTVVFVAGWLVSWGVRVVGGSVYGLVFVVVWMPISLVVGLVQWVVDTIEFVSGFIEFVSSYVDMIRGFVESLLGNDP